MRSHRTTRDAFRDVLRIMARRRWVVAATFVVLAIPLSAFVWTQPPVYLGTARVMIGADDPPVKMGQGAEKPDSVDTSTLQTEAQVVRSRALLLKAVDALKLTERPAVVMLSPTGVGRVTTWFRGMVQGSAPAAGDRSPTPDALADALGARVSVSLVPETHLLDIGVEAADPGFASEAANALADTYARHDLESRFSAVQQTTSFLEDRLARQRAQVEASESALQRYRERQNASSLQDRQNMVVQRLGDLNSAATKAKTERIAREEAYRQLERLQGDPAALERAPVVLENAFIQALKSDLATLERQEKENAEKLGDRHPDMVRLRGSIKEARTRLTGEIGKAVDAVRSAYESALAQEGSLTEALEAQKREAQDLDRKAVEYSALDREAAGNRQLFDSVLQDSKQSGLLSELKTARVRLVDAARRPDLPIRPARASQLALVLVGSLLAAVLAAMGAEQLDPRVRLPDELPGRLGLALMGYIPRERGSEEQLTPGMLAPPVAEAFRRIRTNIVLSRGDISDSRIIAITSAAPREGKTTTSSNLAAVIASTGQSVLLIDGDMRQGRLDGVFGREGHTGLAEVLEGRTTLAEASVPTDVEHLTLLGVGERPPNPAELLNSPRFADVLAEARATYNWVIVDTPPILAVADASVIARFTDGVLFVIMADQTSCEAAQAALDELDRTRTVFVGGVLNRVDLAGNSYYYSRYYSTEHSRYYVHGGAHAGSRKR